MVRTYRQCHDVSVSFFTAVMASDGSGWRARDVDVESTSDLADLGDTLRAVALRDHPVLAVIEREDQWFAIVRADPSDDVRAFVSDSGAISRGQYAELLSPVVDQGPDVPVAPVEDDDPPAAPDIDLTIEDDPPDDIPDVGALSEVEEAATPPPPPLWAGDADLLADLGVDAAALVELVVENPDDPAAALSDLGEQLGFAELLEALR